MYGFKAIILGALIGLSLASPVGNLHNIMLPRLVDVLTGEEVVAPAEVGNANLYIDLVLYNINKKLPSEIILPDIGGTFNLNNCSSYGMDSGLYRDGDATFIVSGNIMKFVLAVQMDDIHFKCNWAYTFLDGNAIATTRNIAISMGLTFTIDHGEHPLLTELRVSNMDAIEVDITGLSLINGIAEGIAESIAENIQDEIINMVEIVIRDAIQEVLNGLTLP